MDWLAIATGALTGLLVGLTRVGGGAVLTPLLVLLVGVAPVTAVGTDLRLTPPRLIAGDIVHAIPLAEFAGLGYLLIGNVNFALLGTLLVGSVPGVVAGAALSARLPHGVLRVVLACLLFVIGARLGWAAFL